MDHSFMQARKHTQGEKPKQNNSKIQTPNTSIVACLSVQPAFHSFLKWVEHNIETSKLHYQLQRTHQSNPNVDE